jgi:nicotinamide riboside kinase
MKTIFVSGPESSGKTSLVKWAAAEFGCPYKLENARHFFEWHPEKLPASANLIRHLFAMQMRIWKNALNEAQKNKAEVLLLDSCPINFYIWHAWYFDETWTQPLEALQDWPTEVQVWLCKPDLPWIDDGQRRNEKDRLDLFEKFKLHWASSGHPIQFVEGGRLSWPFVL